MKISTPPPISSEVIATLRVAIADGATPSRVIAQMREAGLHKMESIKAYRTLYGSSLTDAKIAVHYSETWADRRESDEAFLDSLLESARETGFVEADREGGHIEIFQQTR
jgi:ribosomal protein L7/L12